jgi:hypothetical protein
MSRTSLREKREALATARAARKVTGRHSAERSVMDDFRDADTERLDIPVPPAQDAAVKAASGPQQVLTWNPSADPFAVARDMTQAMELGYPRGEHPYGAPAQDPGRGRQHTRSWAPEFAEAVQAARPYAPGNGLAVPAYLPELPPGTELEPAKFGDYLAEKWPPLGESEERSLDDWHALCSVRYPTLNAGIAELRDFMREYDEITGTRGNGRWPVAALPPADERWGATIAALRDTVELLKDTNPGSAAAHERLLEAVVAAPDYVAARKLTENAADAGITGRVRIYATDDGETVSAAVEVPQDGTAVTAGEASS